MDKICPDIMAGSMEPISINSKTGHVHLAVGQVGYRQVVCGRPVSGQAIYPRPNYKQGAMCSVCWDRYTRRLVEIRAMKVSYPPTSRRLQP
jgi:hypothetical protein